LTSRPSKKIERACLKLGFKLDVSRHHRILTFQKVKKRDTLAYTYLSHGNKDYGDRLLSEVANQLYLSKKELLRFIDGEMTREEYENILRIKGII
jgi:hypothetical protein